MFERKCERYPDAHDVYNTGIAFSLINALVPDYEVQDRIPDFLCEAVDRLFDTLSPPDITEGETNAAPQVLLEMLGPITARALVIAAIYALEMSLRTDPLAVKWCLVAKELEIGRISS